MLVDSDPTHGLLFGGAADLGFGSLSSGTGSCMSPGLLLPAAPMPYPLLLSQGVGSVAALMRHNSCSCSTCSGPSLPGWAGTAGMMMPLGPVAAPAGAGCQYMPAASVTPAASSTAGCYGPIPSNLVLAARPGARMPVFVQGAVAPVSPASPPPVAWITAASADESPAVEACCGSQEGRLQQLKRQGTQQARDAQCARGAKSSKQIQEIGCRPAHQLEHSSRCKLCSRWAVSCQPPQCFPCKRVFSRWPRVGLSRHARGLGWYKCPGCAAGMIP